MTDTITGISTTQVTLSGTADNPATIVGTAVLDVGLYATALSGVAWTITNAGSILDGGIVLQSAGTVENTGGIANAGEVGVKLEAGGSVTNFSSGTISGAIGVYAEASATVVNAGYISGSSYAVTFAAGYTNRLVIDPGATFNGTVTGGNPIGNGKASTLELGSGASAGTLSGIGSQFVDFIGVDVDSGADWVLTGANSIAAESILVNSGTLTDAGTLINYGILLDSGTLIVSGTLAAGAGAAGDVALFGNLLGTLVVERHHRARSLHRHAEQPDWRRQRGNRRR